ncbi:hypothetical protein BX265_7566 [Streptomyces sp. TLI_235]|nr:hypothetical protein BX265_7566 [Streptomyces sp. TLI_235]
METQCRGGGVAAEPPRGGAFVDESAPRVTLLARDRTVLTDLCALITANGAQSRSRTCWTPPGC